MPLCAMFLHSEYKEARYYDRAHCLGRKRYRKYLLMPKIRSCVSDIVRCSTLKELRRMGSRRSRWRAA